MMGSRGGGGRGGGRAACSTKVGLGAGGKGGWERGHASGLGWQKRNIGILHTAKQQSACNGVGIM